MLFLVYFASKDIMAILYDPMRTSRLHKMSYNLHKTYK